MSNSRGATAELIDTLWNVNVIPGLMYYCLDYELIDTLWNVNVFMMSNPFSICFRINRYIMECK